MADGLQIEARGLAEAQRALTQMAVRLTDLSPALKNIAQEIDRRTQQAWLGSKSQFGEPWPPLAESTVRSRVGRLRGANRRTKSGKLTVSSQRLRTKLTAPGGIKPLIDTARAKNSAHCVVDSPTSLRWSAVGYLGPHMTGGERGGKIGRPPMRNPTVFVRKSSGGFDFLGGGGSTWSLDPSMNVYFMRVIDTFVRTKKVG